jgi:hypothetical protein
MCKAIKIKNPCHVAELIAFSGRSNIKCQSEPVLRLARFVFLLVRLFDQQYNRYRASFSKTGEKIGFHFNGLVPYLDINLNLK